MSHRNDGTPLPPPPPTFSSSSPTPPITTTATTTTSPSLSSSESHPPPREMASLTSVLRNLRWVTVILAIGNAGSIVSGGYLLVSWPLAECSGKVRLPFLIALVSSAVRLLCMLGSGLAQVATAATIVNCPTESSSVVDAVIRHERRIRYKRWLWWTRFGMGVTVLQFLSALYLMLIFLKIFSHAENSTDCYLGNAADSRARMRVSVALFLILTWLIVVVQCFTGSDVLRWRSFYATHDTAWKAHYLEVFDHGIREALCCLGRVKYLNVLEEDEVYSVARLLGDLVAYRASGTGHLEFLSGLALLQRQRQSPNLYDGHVEAPESRIRDAAAYHQFAEAAYTGPLLDFGRNPILFPCAWVYRQGVLMPWTHNRRPVLEGDNWWRGHAAAFLKYVNLNPETLRRGRVIQTKREAAYFIVVLHHLKSLVIAIRGTETPEDLLTDGLCRECTLTDEDLDGLINGCNLAPEVRESIVSSSHYGHAGIVNSARELFMQIDGCPVDNDSYNPITMGFLSSLLGYGRECHGYRVCIVGHSLGGSVAALLGIMLYGRFPNLHVYAYGPLPCVDASVAEACSAFVTCIVYNDEFSARLSINSIIRLQTDAIRALSDDSSADSTMICKLARQMLVNRQQNDAKGQCNIEPFHSGILKMDEDNYAYRRNSKYAAIGTNGRTHEPEYREGDSFYESLKYGNKVVQRADIYDNSTYAKHVFECSMDCSFQNGTPCFVSGTSHAEPIGSSPEVFLPGLIVHIVPENRSLFPLWRSWGTQGNKEGYKAFVARRENFEDVVVSPFMFLDHLPWRCHYALQRVLEAWKEDKLRDDPVDGLNLV